MVFPPETIGLISTGGRKRSASPPPHPAMPRSCADYAGGDIYHALARLCGLTDEPDSDALEEIPSASSASA